MSDTPYSFPPVGPNSANPNLKTEEQKSDEFSTHEGTHIARQDDKNNIQTNKQDKLRSDKGFFKIGGRNVKKPTQEELDAAKGISKAAKKEGWKIKIPAIILGVLGAVASVAAAIATCGAAPLIGLAVAALVVGGGVIAGNRRESGAQAAYAQNEQRERNTFQLDDDQTAAGRLQDVQTYMKMEAAQKKAEKKAYQKNFDVAKFSDEIHNSTSSDTKNVQNDASKPPASTTEVIRNAHQDPKKDTNGVRRDIPQPPTKMPEPGALTPKPEQPQGRPVQRQNSPFNRHIIPGLSPRSTGMTGSSTAAKENAMNEAMKSMIKNTGATSIASGRASPKTMPLPQTGNTSQVDQIVQKSVNSIVNNVGKMISAIPGTPTTSAKPSGIATARAGAAGEVAGKEATEVKSKFSNKMLATLDNIATLVDTFMGKDTADITEEEFTKTFQFGSPGVRDIYTAAKNQGLLTKDLLSKLVNKQKKYCSEFRCGKNGLTEQMKKFERLCSEQKISPEAIDAVFEKVESLERNFIGFISPKIANATLDEINKEGGIKGTDSEVLINGDTLKTIFNEVVEFKNTAIEIATPNKSEANSLKELTDELKINTLILSEESSSTEGIERLNGAILNITSGEGDLQQVTFSVKDGIISYQTPDGEEKELDEAGKKHIQNALVFNGIRETNVLGISGYAVTPSTLETKQTLLSDIEKAPAEPLETAAKPTHKDDAIGDDDGEIGSGDLTESTASKDASEVADKSMDAPKAAPSFDELVSKAKSITHRGYKFVSLKNLDIKNFEDIAEDGSNLPSGDREIYLAYKEQGKKLGDMDKFFRFCTYSNNASKNTHGFDGTKILRKNFQKACKSAGISLEDQENIWKVVWASKGGMKFERLKNDINEIYKTIHGHVNCTDEDSLKNAVKLATYTKYRFTEQISKNYSDETVGEFATNCECSTLKLGEDEDNPIDGAILYVDKGETEEEDGETYAKATPISIKTDGEGKFYFKYSLNGTKHTVKEGDDEYETLKQALHDAFVFEPAEDEGYVMLLQEKLNVDEKLAIFTGKNKKATDTTPIEGTKDTSKTTAVKDPSDEKNNNI